MKVRKTASAMTTPGIERGRKAMASSKLTHLEPPPLRVLLRITTQEIRVARTTVVVAEPMTRMKVFCSARPQRGSAKTMRYTSNVAFDSALNDGMVQVRKKLVQISAAIGRMIEVSRNSRTNPKAGYFQAPRRTGRRADRLPVSTT